MGAKLDLTGQQFGKLKVLNFESCKRIGKKQTSCRYWNCLCDCGKTKVISTGSLTSGNSSSCGCQTLENCLKAVVTHGSCYRPEYYALQRIRSRVSNPNNERADIYLNLGIEEEWKTNFESFLEEIGEMPSDGQRWSVGRLDNDIGYYKGNIRWETDDLQSRNHTKQNNNTSGITGVKWQKKNGTETSCVAQVEKLDGKRLSKSFSIQKYGKEVALELAREWRSKMIEELNSQGAGYSEKHGL